MVRLIALVILITLFLILASSLATNTSVKGQKMPLSEITKSPRFGRLTTNTFFHACLISRQILLDTGFP